MTLTPEQLAKFEVWYRNEFSLPKEAKIHSDGSSIHRESYYCYKAWIAAQESLVVELPDNAMSNCSPDYYNGYDQAIYDFAFALQSAGINYREKE